MRHAFITGGSSGIGLALARLLTSRGYAVALAARRRELIESHAAALREGGARAVAVPCDVTDAAAVREAVRSAVAELGPVDLAVANAGISIPIRANRFVLADAEAVLRTNLLGTLNLFDAVIPSMVERRRGRFVGIASLAGLRGFPYSSMYSASKAAVQTFLEASRIELAKEGVGVTVVNPGFIRTPLTDKNRFRMPFLMDVVPAAERIVSGIEKGRRVVEFPFPMSLATRFLRCLPAAVFDRLIYPWGRRRIGERGR